MSTLPLPPAAVAPIVPPVQRRMSPLAWALMAVLALIWSGSFSANHLALAEVGVLTTVAIRVTGGAMLLWTWVLWRGLPVPKNAGWLLTCGVLGLLNNVVPFSLIVWGQTHIASGLAAILNAATAIFSVLLAAMLFPDERLTRAKSLGVALGFAGLVLAVGPEALRGFDLTSLGQLAVLGAAVSYAAAAMFARNALRGVRPETGAAGMLTAAALILVPSALAVEGAPSLDYSPATWGALAYLAAIASALAYMLFYQVLALAGAGNLGLVTLMIAPLAIAIGAVAFGEVLPPSAYGGFGLLALGLLVIDGRLLRAHRR